MSRKKLDPASMTWDASSLLRKYYLAVFRPALCERVCGKRVLQFDIALRRFEEFAGGRTRLGSVSHELLAEFENAFRSRGCSKQLASQSAQCIRSIISDWDGTAALRREVVPPPKPGTLRWYFEEIYKPEVMFNCQELSVAWHVRALRRFRAFVGHDVKLSDLNDSLIAAFLKSLLGKGIAATTANNYRAHLLAVWNHAFENRQTDRAPRIKKLKEIRNPPEAWSVADLRKLLNAARHFRPGQFYGPIPCDRWWPAILLIAYDTALRRGSLTAIRCADVDLSNRLLRIDGATMKTLKGQNFRISEATVAAVREIVDPSRELLFGNVHRAIQFKHFGFLVEAAGIRYHRRKGMTKFHALRRSTATLVAAAAGVGAASSLLGHSDAYVTGRYVDPSAVQLDVTKYLPALVGG